jgi:redox-sensitive bicupin YhaK (pirin superfamily)
MWNAELHFQGLVPLMASVYSLVPMNSPVLSQQLQRLPTQARQHGAGLTLNGLRASAAELDPFIMVDHFRMTQPTFPPHPHAGFSAVTYLFDDSETGFLNRDSLGFEGPIEAGALHWTLAGNGVMHEEFPLEAGRVAHGLQIFVNLPLAQKLRAPQALQLAAAQMPQLRGPGWRARLVFGSALGHTAPLVLPVQASLVVIDIEPGAHFEMPLAAGEQGFVLAISGQGAVSGETVSASQAWRSAAGQALAASTPLRLAFFAGRALQEPVVQHGPFVMASEAQIVDAMRRYQSGGMGRLAPYAHPSSAGTTAGAA